MGCTCTSASDATKPPRTVNPAKEYDQIYDTQTYTQVRSETYTKEISQDEARKITNRSIRQSGSYTIADVSLSILQDMCFSALNFPRLEIPGLSIFEAFNTADDVLSVNVIPGTYTSTVALYVNADGDHIVLTNIDGPMYSDYNTGWEMDYVYRLSDSLYDYAFPIAVGVIYP